MADVVRHGRLKWFGHLECKSVRRIGHELAEIWWRPNVRTGEDLGRICE